MYLTIQNLVTKVMRFHFHNTYFKWKIKLFAWKSERGKINWILADGSKFGQVCTISPSDVEPVRLLKIILIWQWLKDFIEIVWRIVSIQLRDNTWLSDLVFLKVVWSESNPLFLSKTSFCRDNEMNQFSIWKKKVIFLLQWIMCYNIYKPDYKNSFIKTIR